MVAVSQRQIAAGVAFLATAVILQWRFDALKSLLAGLLAVPVFVAAGVAFLAAGALVAVTRLDKTQQVPSFRERQRDATRSLAFAVGNKWAKALAERQIEDMEEQFDAIYGLEGPKVSSRLDQLLSLIRGSFILPWYMKISPSRAFPDAVECNVRHALGQVGRRAEVVDWPNLVVYRILPIVTEHFQHYRSIEHLSASITATPSSSLPLPLPRSPHAALNARNRISAESNIPAIEDHFRATVARILADVLPASEQSEVVSTIVREIVLGAILLPVFNMLCDSDFWNRQIDEQGGKYLYERWV
jgi:sorting nexin-25